MKLMWIGNNNISQSLILDSGVVAVVVCIGIYLLLLGVGVSAGRVRIRRRLPAAAIMVGVGIGFRTFGPKVFVSFGSKGFRVFWVRIRKVSVNRILQPPAASIQLP